MPEEGVEPTLPRGELDFESSASAYFATPAGCSAGIIAQAPRDANILE